MSREETLREVVRLRWHYLDLTTKGQLPARKGLAVLAYLADVKQQLEARIREEKSRAQ